MEEKKKEELKEEKNIKNDAEKSEKTNNQEDSKKGKNEKDLSTKDKKTKEEKETKPAEKQDSKNTNEEKKQNENTIEEKEINESKSTFKVVKPSESNTKDENVPKEKQKSKGKSKEKKTKKKGNGGKVFLVILLIIILAIVIHYVKNQIIFGKMNNSAVKYTSLENYEVKREITGTDMKNTTDAKYLNGLYKVTFTQSDNSILTIVTMQNKIAMFTEKNGVKTVKFLNKDKVSLDGIIGLENRTLTSNVWYDNLCSKICTRNEDGKNYFLPTVGAHTEAYINRETGLIEKIIEKGKDGNVLNTTTYQYEFNNVKTTDLGISDITSYKLAE